MERRRLLVLGLVLATVGCGGDDTVTVGPGMFRGAFMGIYNHAVTYSTAPPSTEMATERFNAQETTGSYAADSFCGAADVCVGLNGAMTATLSGTRTDATHVTFAPLQHGRWLGHATDLVATLGSGTATLNPDGSILVIHLEWNVSGHVEGRDVAGQVVDDFMGHRI